MACKMTDEQMKGIDEASAHAAILIAKQVHEAGGSLGSAREAAIVAFTAGFDAQAAAILAGDA